MTANNNQEGDQDNEFIIPESVINQILNYNNSNTTTSGFTRQDINILITHHENMSDMPSTTNVFNNININNDQDNPRGISHISERRNRALRRLLQYLLVLDRLLLAVFFPLSIYNLTKALMNGVTFSKLGIAEEILMYWDNVNVLQQQSCTTDTNFGIDLLYISNENSGLLSKFHNVLVYYTQEFILPYLNNDNYSSGITYAIKKLTLTWYPRLIKLNTLVIYLGFGIFTSTYFCFAVCFFFVCITLSFLRRYLSVMRVVNKLTSATLQW
ncbi:Asi2p SCDLUD_002844 [Saccharomycodes ludwigii]|uniref:Asi2p n=1 Tax=Saccharomycodes ludwigii TaxID=36035 RepID=UPI001E8A08E2|nr:hypothetical protein SCDLUD_002844 [Saccharomycodes ludwigii]KAH3901352.1 hypothetical protein SCDLUD_002844 [Saccharomycodes ludwigii]